MKLNQENLEKSFTQVPHGFDNAMTKAFEKIHQGNPPKRYAGRLRFATVLVAALLLITAVSVAAGVHFGIFDFMTEQYGQDGILPEASELLQKNVGSLDLPNIIMKAEEAIFDGGNLKVVLSVTQRDAKGPLLDGSFEDANSAFRKALEKDQVNVICDWLTINGTEYTMPGESIVTTLPGENNGELLCYMDIVLSAWGIAPEEPFIVGLPVARMRNDDKNMLVFQVETASQERILPSQNAKGATVTVLNSSLSPVRAYVNLRVEIDDGILTSEADSIFADWQDALLVDAQGQKLSSATQMLITNREQGEWEEYAYTFMPTTAEEAYIAPASIDDHNQRAVDMSRALKVK